MFSSHQLNSCMLEIKDLTGMRISDFCELIDLNTTEFLNFRNGSIEASLSGIERFSKHVNIPINSIIAGDFDRKTIVGQSHGNEVDIPDRYLEPGQQLGLKTSIRNCIQYLSQIHGFEFTRRILSQLQVPYAYFFSNGEFVSPCLQLDILSEMRRRGFTSNALYGMGLYSGASRFKDLKRLNQGHIDKSDFAGHLEQYIISVLSQFDHIFRYELFDADTQGVVIGIKPRGQSKYLFSEQHRTCNFPCHFKKGLFVALLKSTGIRDIHIQEPNCFHRGDSHCLYNIEF